MSRSATRVGIIAVVSLVVSAVVFGGLFMKTKSEETQLHEQVETLAVHQAQQNALFKLRKTAEETTADREALQSPFFVRGSDSVDFLNEIEQLAPRVGVEIETESLHEVTDESKKEWLEMNFALAGKESAIANFIELVELSPYALRIMSISQNEVDGRATEASLTVRVRLLNYDI